MRSPAGDDSRPEILSLDEFNVAIPRDVYDHLSKQYSALDYGETKHIDRILECMKKAPSVTCCRVNNIRSSVKEVEGDLKKYFAEKIESHNKSYSIQQHKTLTDLVTIRATDVGTSGDANLYYSKAPPSMISLSNGAAMTDENNDHIFPNWQLRHEQGWPTTHKCVIIDRFCAEAVLRGADVFVKGILCADAGIQKGEEVAVYANLPRSNNSTTSKPITKGMFLQNYCDRCVFIGIGISQCKRAHYFAQTFGLGVVMISTAGYPQPPLNGALVGKMLMQNLPSVVVAHALNPQPGEVVLAMCCAPGGKTTHLTSLMNDNGLIIACDKSRKKVITARDFFRTNASCIVPLALDSTKELLTLNSGESWKSPMEIINSASIASDGLKDVNGFYLNSFDQILLDPPCSALGLRPKLQIDTKSSKELLKAADYQRK
jgi:16S rRNA C967 or C1407 C5-methylase (RsmB/RsmF family)